VTNGFASIKLRPAVPRSFKTPGLRKATGVLSGGPDGLMLNYFRRRHGIPKSVSKRLALGECDQLHHFIAAGMWNATPVETDPHRLQGCFLEHSFETPLRA